MAGFINRLLSEPPWHGWWMRWLPRDIRSRIFLVALLALLPFALLVLGNALVRHNAALRGNREAVRIVAAAFDALAQDIRRQETAIGSAIGTRGAANWGWTVGLLQAGVNQYPSLRNMNWVSSQGRVLASSVSRSFRPDISGSAVVRQLRAGDSWVISDLLPSAPVSNRPAIVMARAIRTGAPLQGMVVAELEDLDSLNRILLSYPRPAGGIYVVFDRQGHLVFSEPPHGGTWDARTDWYRTDPLLRRALREHRETYGTVAPATFDVSLYAAYLPIANTGYVAGVVTPRGSAGSPAWSLLLLLLVTGLVGFVAFRISRSIVDPVRAMQADTKRLGRKEAMPPLPQTAPTELHRLHDALTVMAATLFQRIDTGESDLHRLNMILEQLPAGVRFVDAGGNVRLANAIAREMLGEGAPGMTSTPRGRYTLHHPDGSPLPLAEIPLIRALHEGVASRNQELIIRYESGDGILALFSANPVRDAEGAVTGVVEVVVEVVSDVAALQNITVSTKLEQQLAEARVRLQTLLEILPVGVFILDAQGRVVSVNAESTRLWGGMLPSVNAVGDFRFFHGWWTRSGEPLRPDEWPPVRALTRNETVLNEAITLNRFDGLRGDVLTSAAPLRDAHGAVIGAVWVLQDVVTRK
ncbi:MAG: PAS domain-containing protein [Armatimonadota bacterium]